jgi:hypothetical protein
MLVLIEFESLMLVLKLLLSLLLMLVLSDLESLIDVLALVLSLALTELLPL